jgi:redox-sensitive bicupin YhaK (pirin superfamily)
MTAASGILHKEYHENEFSRSGGDFQMVQLWVNLPARYKMAEPKYQALKREGFVKCYLPGNSGVIEVISGEYQDMKGPASTFTPIHTMNAHLDEGAAADFSFPKEYHTLCLVIEGSILINGEKPVAQDQLVLFRNDGEMFSIKSTGKSTLLVMSGEPIHEPIAAYGPFVMNTRDELIQAFSDLEAGKFGHLEN